jgi:hypothetical protein
MDKEPIIFILICWMTFCLYKFIQEIISDIKESKLILKSTYPKLIKEVLYYCAPIYKAHQIKYYPLHQISYYPSKKRLGYYDPSLKKLVIHINSHDGSESSKIRQIVHTTLHEIKHHIQHQKNPDFKNYAFYSKKLSYQKNPFEIDSNAFADKHTDDCIKYLKERGILE